MNKFDHIGRLKSHLEDIATNTEGLYEALPHMHAPINLDDHDTYLEIQDAIIAIGKAQIILCKAFRNLMGPKAPKEH